MDLHRHVVRSDSGEELSEDDVLESAHAGQFPMCLHLRTQRWRYRCIGGAVCVVLIVVAVCFSLMNNSDPPVSSSNSAQPVSGHVTSTGQHAFQAVALSPANNRSEAQIGKIARTSLPEHDEYVKTSSLPSAGRTQDEAHVNGLLPGTSGAFTSTREDSSIYCFVVMLPFGGEVDLVRTQYERSLGVFKCDAHTIFSNVSFALSSRMPHGEKTVAFGGNMVVQFNDWTWAKYGTRLALNTGVFVRVWKLVFQMGIWKDYDWTIKIDPDTVLLPNRQRYLLNERPLVPGVESNGEDGLQCHKCMNVNRTDDTCASHVQWLQSQGLTCTEALADVARAPPLDCGCRCDETACHKPFSVYLRNCAVNMNEPTDKYPTHAMHGPLEVLSAQAMEDYRNGIDRCVEELKDSFTQWGEDWFLERCLLLLGVNPVDSFSSLKDGDCQTSPWPCLAPHAAFQPFKDVYGYVHCTENAMMNGSWPPTGPQYAEHKFWNPETKSWATRG